MEAVDPITLGVLWGALQAVAEEMGVALRRTAYSEAVREGLDFSTAVFDARGRMLAQGNFSPGHLGAMPSVVTHVLEAYPPESWSPGDAVLLNDLYLGSGHLPDCFVTSPVFAEGELVGFVVNCAHQVDMGGAGPGSQSVEGVREFYQEGLRILPVKFYQGGQPVPEILRLISANVRVPDKVLGNFQAQVGANYVGARRLAELYAQYGRRVLARYSEEILDRTEAAMRAAIRTIPDGTYRFTDYLDDCGRDTDPITVAVAVTVRGDEVTVDFAGSSPQVAAAMNSTYNYTASYSFFAIKSVTDPRLPHNAGGLRPIRVVAPPGSFFNPLPPAPGGGRAIVQQRIVDALMGALAQAVPERVVAPASHWANPNFGGVDPRTGKRFVFYDVIIGGFGARPTKDGCESLAPCFNVNNIPVEVSEANYPVRIERLEFIPDSAGAGTFRGGCGLRKDIRVLGEEVVLSNLGERHRFAPYSLCGGLPPRRGCTLLNPGPQQQQLHSKGVYLLRRGDLVRFELCGAGGYGDPLKRDPAAVQRDVRGGYVSLQAAREVYGVCLDPETLAIDEDATRALRARRGGRP
ncbi:MAG: hydantoinase [Candidatus Tectimicrobiota bacterium]|nr:MAG: hydantoinase [Candidatus Tectomicrobia bacterium]